MSRGWLAPHPLPWYRCTVFPASSEACFLLPSGLVIRKSAPPGSRRGPSVTLWIFGSRFHATTISILVLQRIRCRPPKSLARCEVAHRTGLRSSALTCIGRDLLVLTATFRFLGLSLVLECNHLRLGNECGGPILRSTAFTISPHHR